MTRKRIHQFALTLLFLALSTTVFGQEPPAPTTEGSNQALRIFLDCNRRICDDDFFRQEITFVNYMRDRQDAQVHVLVTRETTGGGGRAYTMDFIGLETFEGLDDQLTFFEAMHETDYEIQMRAVQMLRLGLMRYAAETPLAEQLTIEQQNSPDRRSLSAQPKDDPWNFWVFRARLNTRLDLEESETSKEFGGSLSANHITEDWKVNLGIWIDYDEDSYELSNKTTLLNIRRNNAITARFIKSFGEHVGLGFGGSAVSSTYRNQDITVHLAPAIEYNFFPYSESTRKQFTVNYSLGYTYFDYDKITLFDKTTEQRPSHGAMVSLDLNQPWGESGVTMEYRQFLNDASKYRVVLFGRFDVRVFRGFSFNVRGDASLIRDQIFLARSGITDAEILLKQRQLATDYEYGLRVGFTYTFGSIYNNVVNSRFAGSNGGFIRAF